MRYNQLRESTGKSVRDLNLLPDFWNQDKIKLWGRELVSLDGCPTEVKGYFGCQDNLLTSLAGSPQTVGGGFHCGGNQLTSLASGPQTVCGSYDCTNNLLTSLKHAPTTVGGDFNCGGNQLTSLVHSPQNVNKDFLCGRNSLTSLAGSPESVNGGFFCTNNRLTSLAGCPPIVGGDFDCGDNQLTSLADIHTHVQQMNGDLSIGGNPIVSHLLGILLIRGCQRLQFKYTRNITSPPLKQAIGILNRYMGQGKAGIMDCQAELLVAGLDDFAQI